MVAVKTLLAYLAFSSATLAAPPPNNVDLSVTDITNIDTNIKKLTDKAKSYNGGLVWALPQIPLALQAAVAAASVGVHSSLLPQPLSVEDLLRLVDHVNKTIAVSSPLAVDTFIGKKSLYEQAGLQTSVHLGLRVFLVLHQRFAENILNRAPSDAPKDRVETAKRDMQVVKDALQRGIDAFA